MKRFISSSIFALTIVLMMGMAPSTAEAQLFKWVKNAWQSATGTASNLPQATVDAMKDPNKAWEYTENGVKLVSGTMQWADAKAKRYFPYEIAPGGIRIAWDAAKTPGGQQDLVIQYMSAGMAQTTFNGIRTDGIFSPVRGVEVLGGVRCATVAEFRTATRVEVGANTGASEYPGAGAVFYNSAGKLVGVSVGVNTDFGAGAGSFKGKFYP